MMRLSISDEQTNTELHQSQTHIWNHIFHFISSMSLKTAVVELEIPDIINNHGGTISLSDLLDALPINKRKSDCVKRLMCILTHSGFFVTLKEENLEDFYALTPSSLLLLKDEPLSMRPLLQAVLDPVLVDPWHSLGKWFANDDFTPFETAHGSTFWDYLGRNPKINKLFNDAMASDARSVSNLLVKEYCDAFEGLNSIVDVGGGTGTMAKAIAEAFPHMTVVNFDLPQVVGGLEDNKNLRYVEGDMFVAIPPTDAILLKWILHDWSDDDCLKILKRCKEAISSKEKGGKLMIIDMVVKNKGDIDDRSLETQLLFDMQMMVLVVGKERNEDEWAKLFFGAGFSEYKITSIFDLKSFIEVYP